MDFAQYKRCIVSYMKSDVPPYSVLDQHARNGRLDVMLAAFEAAPKAFSQDLQEDLTARESQTARDVERAPGIPTALLATEFPAMRNKIIESKTE